MRRILALAALITLTACSTTEATPAPVTLAPTTSSPSPSPAVSTNTETDTACRLADEATRGEFAELDDRATIEAIILNAGKSNIEAVKLAGVRMDGRYSAWSRAEAGDGDYATAADELLEAARQVVAACTDAGVGG